MRARRFVVIGAVVVLSMLSLVARGAQADPLIKVAPVKLGCNLKLPVGQSHCNAIAIPGLDGKPLATSGPTSGLAPADVQAAYALTGAATPAGARVVIVDAYDDPNAEADLAVYRSYYHLPACTKANGCFKKVNGTGAASPLPKGDQGWGTEITLDLDAVSAACPGCGITLVEATSNSNTDLYTADRTAGGLGTVVSNSYGGSESSSETSSDASFFHAGVPYTVSSGDSGYGVEYPAASPNVIAVGGTTLNKAAGTARGWTEAAWSGAGSGCSAYEAKPSWQVDAGCAKRTVADVSAVADPNTGLAIYDSYCTGINKLLGNCFSGWGQVGGTSLAAPVVAAVIALAGSGITPAFPYAHTAGINDVTSGNNGSCSGSYLCTSGAGYDGPTGLGTPKGTGGF